MVAALGAGRSGAGLQVLGGHTINGDTSVVDDDPARFLRRRLGLIRCRVTDTGPPGARVVGRTGLHHRGQGQHPYIATVGRARDPTTHDQYSRPHGPACPSPQRWIAVLSTWPVGAGHCQRAVASERLPASGCQRRPVGPVPPMGGVASCRASQLPRSRLAGCWLSKPGPRSACARRSPRSRRRRGWRRQARRRHGTTARRGRRRDGGGVTATRHALTTVHHGVPQVASGLAQQGLGVGFLDGTHRSSPALSSASTSAAAATSSPCAAAAQAPAVAGICALRCVGVPCWLNS